MKNIKKLINCIKSLELLCRAPPCPRGHFLPRPAAHQTVDTNHEHIPRAHTYFKNKSKQR